MKTRHIRLLVQSSSVKHQLLKNIYDTWHYFNNKIFIITLKKMLPDKFFVCLIKSVFFLHL